MKKDILKRVLSLICIGSLGFSFVGCAEQKKEIPTVQISLWSDEASMSMLKEELDEFKVAHKEQANFEFQVNVEGEDTCKATVLQNPEAAADLYSFADDQLEELYQNNALLEITANKEQLLQAAGGENSGAAQAVLRGGKMYAYPLTAGNGYFLYYNKKYLNENDVQSLDRILEVAEKNKKKFSMEYSSGWYIFSFFKGAGLDANMNADGKSIACNWNATDTKYKGVDVVKAMMKIAQSDGFSSRGDDAFMEGVQKGEIIAGINGPWNASKLEKIWGDDYAATKLPTYTLNGEQVQMNSIIGYKLWGINKYTKYPEYCMALAEYLTNEKNQLRRFEETGECPANIKAAANEKVQKSPAIAALGKQAQYGHVRNLVEPYWQATSKLGIVIESGNRDGKDLQRLLDETQKEITKTQK